MIAFSDCRTILHFKPEIFAGMKNNIQNPYIIILIQIPIIVYGILRLTKEIFAIPDYVILTAGIVAIAIFIADLLYFLHCLFTNPRSIKSPRVKWNLKRTAALLLTFFLAIMAFRIFQTGDIKTGLIVVLGVILGIVYTANGKVPDWYIEFNQRHNLSSGSITRDDDAANISWKIYIPIILTAVLAAAIAFFIMLD